MEKEKEKSSSVIHYLRAREMGFCASMPRNDYKILKNLILSENRVYSKTQEFNSSSSISFESNRVYVDHYRRAFSAIRKNMIYDFSGARLAGFSPAEKIVDADIFYLTSPSEPSEVGDCSEIFVGLTNFNKLVVMDALTGRRLHSLQFAFDSAAGTEEFKFSEFVIGKDNETFYVKGKLSDKRPLRRRSSFVFAIFHLVPFRYDGMFVVTRQAMGDFINVHISQDMLIVVRHESKMDFYSLDQVLGNATKKDANEAKKPIFMHPNLVLNPMLPPDCLYQIRVTSEILEMGGFPWHCLYKPPDRKNNHYVLRGIEDGKYVFMERDQFRQMDPSLGMEVNVFFHPDEGGSVLHVTEDSIQKFVIIKCDDDDPPSRRGLRKLQLVWTLPVIKDARCAAENIFYTSSGRKASRSSWTCQDELQYVHCVHYLSSIDSLCVVIYYETPISEEEPLVKKGRARTTGRTKKTTTKDVVGGKAKLLIVDNPHGRITKEILLDEQWNNTMEEHQIELDDDILVHNIKHRSGKHSCHVYRLTEVIDEDLQDDHQAFEEEARSSSPNSSKSSPREASKKQKQQQSFGETSVRYKLRKRR